MDKTALSILHQKAKGTYKRNEYIRKLFSQDGENYAEIGRQFHITRQAIRKIVQEGSES